MSDAQSLEPAQYAAPLRPLTPARKPRSWKIGRYEFTRFPRQGRWSCTAQLTPSSATGTAGSRSALGAFFSVWRTARTIRRAS